MAAANMATAAAKRSVAERGNGATPPARKEIILDDGETIYFATDTTATVRSPTSPPAEEDTARVQISDDGEVVYREQASDSDSDEGDSGELTPAKRDSNAGRVDPDEDSVVRRADYGDSEVVRIASPDDLEVVRRDFSDDPEVVIRDVPDDPEVVIRHHVSDDPEVVIRQDVSDDPEVVIRSDVSDDPEIVIRSSPDYDPEVVRHSDPELVVHDEDDPEVVRVPPSATGLLVPHASRLSGGSDDSDPKSMRVSPRRHHHRKEKKDRPGLVILRAPFNNCDSTAAETLWMRVLSYLLPHDLCTASLVCSEMKGLADDDDLWQYYAFKKMSYTTKPENRPWKEVYGMRNRFVEENRIRARRENYVIVDGRVVDVVNVKSVEKGRQGLVTYVTGFDVFTDVLLEGKLGTAFVPLVLGKEECALVSLLPDNKMKVKATNGERAIFRPSSLTPEMIANINRGAVYLVEVLTGMGRERALRVYPRQPLP